MNTVSPNRPLVSVAVIVEKGPDILIGEDRRKGANIYGVPGGHLEAGKR
jgi:ADP-ribose pyrophosphatase YjhB (NUDIX family)